MVDGRVVSLLHLSVSIYLAGWLADSPTGGSGVAIWGAWMLEVDAVPVAEGCVCASGIIQNWWSAIDV